MAIREAVSAVFVYGHEVFMMERQPYLPAFPGYLAFPGGKVERDEATTPYTVPHLRDGEPRQMHALAREIEEELGFDLEAACRDGLVTAVTPLCSATTPAFEHYRFCNRFFRIDLAARPVFQADSEEVARAVWDRPDVLLGHWETASALVVPPLRTMLRALSEDIQATTIEGVDFTYDEARFVPAMEVLPDLWILPVRSHTLPPADRTNALLVGGVLVDPSPRDEAELDRLIHTLDAYDGRGFEVDALMLTHHHGDHHQLANVLARRKGLPLAMSADTHTRILGRMGADYFKDLKIRILQDGDVLTTWRGQAVQVLAVPGHDEGQLAPTAMDGAWCLVGDLIQGVGTVVISAPEGHMGRYFASLERVIALDPRVIIPSHGIAMGSTYRLKATLAHRREREREVLRLHEEGKPMLEILDTIYQGLDERLRPLAMANIQAHLQKLREEQRV